MLSDKLISNSNGSFATFSFPITINVWFSASEHNSVLTTSGLNCVAGLDCIIPFLYSIVINVIAVKLYPSGADTCLNK